MEFSMDQPSILATLRADYLLFLSQRLMCAHRRDRRVVEMRLESLWPVGASRLVLLSSF